jgi:hypothetical protein
LNGLANLYIHNNIEIFMRVPEQVYTLSAFISSYNDDCLFNVYGPTQINIHVCIQNEQTNTYLSMTGKNILLNSSNMRYYHTFILPWL